MASFDVIEAAGKGYAITFQERGYLARMAVIPVLIKIVSYVAVMALGWQHNYLRQAMLMLPAFLAEGWLLAHFIRFIFLGQRWPFQPSGDEEKDLTVLQERAQGVIAGAVFYALAHFLLIGLFATIQKDGAALAPLEPGVSSGQDRTFFAFFVALGFFVASIWAFRFLWLFIPASINYSVRRFLVQIAGFSTSLYMVGTWLVCFVPFMFLFGIFSSLFLVSYYENPAAIPPLLDYVFSILNIIAGMIVSIITAAGLAYGIQDIIKQNETKDHNSRKL